jgi:hypothetical protein
MRATPHTLFGILNFHSKLVAIAVSIAFGAIVVVPAPSQNVGPGENAFNAGIYKGTHNSYSHHESLAQQIDNYNVWQIELDIYDFYGDLKVNHDCDPSSISRADTLETLVNKMVTESTTYFYKFTVIYLDMKGNGLDGCAYGWGVQIKDRIKNIFIHSLGITHIYKTADFINEDRSQWPSYQALVGRGFYWCVVVDWHEEKSRDVDYGCRRDDAIDDILFCATSQNPPVESSLSQNTVLVNVDGGCDANPTATTPVPDLRSARWLYRLYPGGGCDCQQQNGNYWENGVSKSYNFIATNCVNWDHTFEPSTHSPVPLYVDRFANVSCPNNYVACDWGTHAFPYHNLIDAIARASPMVTLFIQGGEYQVTAPSVPLTINHPMILTASGGGSVVMR